MSSAEDKQEKIMNTVTNVFAIILFSFIGILGFYSFRGIYYSIPASYRIKPECEYKLPDNCKLHKEYKSGKYAIYVNSFGYLYNYHMGEIYHGSQDEAELFTDSCKAKAYCHKCIIQNTPKHNFQQVK